MDPHTFTPVCLCELICVWGIHVVAEGEALLLRSLISAPAEAIFQPKRTRYA